VRIVLDNAILVRGHDSAKGLARDLLITIVESEHILLLRTGEGTVLREAAEMVVPNPLLLAPIRDINDTVVMQTAVIGEADVLCTKDRDFFEPPADAFLRKAGIAVLDDLSLIRRLRS